ncbi:MAG: chromosomal replication initiator DnaA [Rhodobiaceae bacterium]|nr:chromosomal replication initiator DnaA [Rhodobiaceae bacterium]
MTSAQLPFDLPHRVALGRDDFLVAEANSTAVALIDQWPDWPTHLAMLVGPAGSGKTHLGEVWRAASGATLVNVTALEEAYLPALVSAKAVLLEDIDQLPPSAETALFHLINLIKEEHGHLLLTAKVGPAQLDISLPDLASRLRAAVTAGIGVPDDMLLAAVLEKLFQDRQLPVPQATIRYLTLHMDRSIAAARTLVGEVDKAALAGKRRITVPLVADVLKHLSSAS